MTIVSLACAALTAGCATRPESIAASYISHERYTDQSCQTLSFKMLETLTELNQRSKQQDGKADADAWSVFLWGIPLSKLSSGDFEGDIARLKGEVQAIKTAQIALKCPGLEQDTPKNAK
ncbi:hypothetical protein [Verminephrobacter eiseniae]|uniref:hypothetical protein n=1 Tax=Verminephrobacter eiseniae TaxID=364317 RepID=UPI002238DA97|nr:hypothetical protein [Verminephrobacter eiseniae]MCW5237435.1 hypothetical protein [Verminephrobacter eiseniae]